MSDLAKNGHRTRNEDGTRDPVDDITVTIRGQDYTVAQLPSWMGAQRALLVALLALDNPKVSAVLRAYGVSIPTTDGGTIEPPAQGGQ